MVWQQEHLLRTLRPVFRLACCSNGFYVMLFCILRNSVTMSVHLATCVYVCVYIRLAGRGVAGFLRDGLLMVLGL